MRCYMLVYRLEPTLFSSFFYILAYELAFPYYFLLFSLKANL
jgi:hypothetical protein